MKSKREKTLRDASAALKVHAACASVWCVYVPRYVGHRTNVNGVVPEGWIRRAARAGARLSVYDVSMDHMSILGTISYKDTG